MAGLKKAIRSPKIQALSFLLIVGLLYFLLATSNEETSDLDIIEQHAYLAVGRSGVQVVDVSDSSHPTLITEYDTPGSANQFEIVDQYLYLADGDNGFVILSIEEPIRLQFISQIDTPGSAQDVAISGNKAYIADGKAGLVVIDISNHKNPAIFSQFKPGGFSYRILHQNKTIYLANQSSQVSIIDVNEPKSPTQKSLIETQGNVLGLTIDDDRLYLASDQAGMAIVNIANIENPEPIGFYNTRGRATSITIAGHYAYIADGASGVVILEIIDPAQPAEVGQFVAVNDAIDIAVRENKIYVADGTEGLRILDQDLQLLFKVLSPENQPVNVQDVAVNGTYAYLANESQGVRVLDITNPQEPKEVGLYDTPENAVSVTTAGDYIYVADGKGDVRILFISSSDANSVELAEKSHLELAGDSYNIYLDGKYGYVAAGNAGLRVVNLEDPAAPREVGFEERATIAQGVIVLGDYAFIAGGTNGLQIVNITDRTKPALISSFDTPNEAKAVSLARSITGGERVYAFVADGDGGIRVIDVTDPRQPKEVGVNLEPEYAYDVLIPDPFGKYAYVSGRTDGLWVLDISDPTHPTEIGFLDTPGEAHGLAYQNSMVYIADMERGMQIANVTNPFTPSTIGFFDVPRQVGDVIVDRNAYLIDGGRGLRVVDVQEPQDPREIGFYDTPGRSRGLAVQGNYAYMGAENNLKILDISTPSSPKETGSFGIPMPVTAVTVKDDYAYVANGIAGLRLVQIANPTQPGSAGTYDTPGNAQDVFVAENYAYIADGEGGVSIANISDRNSPQTTSLLSQIEDGQGVIVVGNYAYIAGGANGVFAFNVSKPAAPEQVTSQDTPGSAQDLAAMDDFLFLADGSAGVQVYYILYKDQLQSVGAYQTSGESLALDVVPMKVKEWEPRHYYVYIASGELGLQIVDASQSMSPAQIGLYNTPGIYPPLKTLIATPKSVVTFISGRGEEVPHKVWASIQTYLFDLLVFAITLLFWFGLVAQYILPVESPYERLEVIRCLFSYLFGTQSAAIAVKEGAVYAGPGKPKGKIKDDKQTAGVGVVLVDASSAIILQNDSKPPVKNVRIKGPGLVFTGQRGSPKTSISKEHLRGTADLRRQIRSRLSVYGYTRDGIEVKANVNIQFSIGEPPEVLKVGYAGKETYENIKVIVLGDEAGIVGKGAKTTRKIIIGFSDELEKEDKQEIHKTTQARSGSTTISGPYNLPKEIGSGPLYAVDPQRIFSAVFSQARDTQEQRYLDWTELPAYAAAEIFRIMLAQEVYDALYMPKKEDDYPLAQMRSTFSKRVRNLGVLAYQYVKRRDGEFLQEGQVWDGNLLSFYSPQELHFPRVLRSRGIKVLVAGFSNLEPTSDKVKERMMDYWSASWERDATVTEAALDLDAMRVRNLARAQAQSEMVLALAQILQLEQASQEAMAFRVFQALEVAATDPRTQKLLPNETIAMLRTLRGWLLPGADQPPFEGVLPPPPTDS